MQALFTFKNHLHNKTWKVYLPTKINEKGKLEAYLYPFAKQVIKSNLCGIDGCVCQPADLVSSDYNVLADNYYSNGITVFTLSTLN
jgi:hypothetical protein